MQEGKEVFLTDLNGFQTAFLIMRLMTYTKKFIQGI